MSRDPLIVGGIVGDVVDYFDASARLRVLYSNREITNGSELRPSQVADQPTVRITGRSGSLYTLVSGCSYIEKNYRLRACVFILMHAPFLISCMHIVNYYYSMNIYAGMNNVALFYLLLADGRP